MPQHDNTLLSTEVRSVTSEEAEQIAVKHFGIAGRARSLPAERDQNFHLRADDGEEFVLKLTHPLEDAEVTAFQTGAYLHIAKVDPTLPTPHLLPATRGGAEAVLHFAGEPVRTARLMQFLRGTPLNKAPRSGAQRQALGAVLARLGLALRGYFHRGAGHALLWDIKRGAHLRPLLAHLADPDQRALATRALDRFEALALPVLPTLRAQVINNDFQPWNVLVDGEDFAHVSGVIDFGDMVHAPLIDDLAVACAYQLGDPDAPLAPLTEIVSAYHRLLPLEPAELAILLELIACRCVMTVAITNWRAGLHPENATYILRNAPPAWAALECLDRLPRDEALQRWRQACGMN